MSASNGQPSHPSGRVDASPGRMLLRGAVKHCPLCGSGHLFEGWFRMRERCPRCGYRFEREEGFFLGGYVINLAVIEGVLLVLVFVPCIVLLAADPDANLVPVVIAGAVAAVLAPIAFFPFSRTVWLAIDLLLRPSHAREPTDRL